MLERNDNNKNEKAVVTMMNWQLSIQNERYNLSGTADKHPTIGINAYVGITSDLVDYKFKDEILIYETRNTIYICPLKYMTIKPYYSFHSKYKLELIHKYENATSILDKIIAVSAKLSLEHDRDSDETGYLSKSDGIDYQKLDFSSDEWLARIKEMQIIGQKEIQEAENKENDRLISIAKQYDDCIYIEVSNICCGDKLAYHLGDYCGTISPKLHSGMFQDSVLYCKKEYDDFLLDFRYFPSDLSCSMETYSCSDNIKVVAIKNKCGEPITFNKVKLNCDEVKVFPRLDGGLS